MRELGRAGHQLIHYHGRRDEKAGESWEPADTLSWEKGWESWGELGRAEHQLIHYHGRREGRVGESWGE